ncbi:hypothetical protein COK00_12645 [Bacillus cereus]|uniref:hypothetical protein n=1 Tax=Bacillus cereus TaxID=1396 RepID=UPI000BF97946|nr:hypothetical protein [Bacillus cereus]PEX37910.1 hypothetical protein CN455_15135 [Bacillus cereus]PFB19623.1 hypothetical protein CN399_01030 [Bacillus cereus]PFP64819.1 hypothetical protein COK00_12645 [Bacillus cereus]PFV57618.1 hypothetical protein COL09_14780 [Bacillus cereus]
MAIWDLFKTKPQKCLMCYQREAKRGLEYIHKTIDYSRYNQFLSESWIVKTFMFHDQLEEHQSRIVSQLANERTLESWDGLSSFDKLACDICINRKKDELEEKFKASFMSMNSVKTYPASYSGKLKLNDNVSPNIETYKLYEDKWLTINKMKFNAIWDGYDVIYNIVYDYNQGTATGVFARLEK